MLPYLELITVLNGSEMALVQPGKSIDLVLNRDSKRKTSSVVLIDGLEHTFGSEAVGLVSGMR